MKLGRLATMGTSLFCTTSTMLAYFIVASATTKAYSVLAAEEWLRPFFIVSRAACGCVCPLPLRFLRSSHSAQVHFCSSSSHLSSFLPSTCMIWNSLPVAISSAWSVSSFTSLLDQFFASDTYSSWLSLRRIYFFVFFFSLVHLRRAPRLASICYWVILVK